MAEINYYAGITMVGSDIQLNKNELQLPVIDNEATAPSSPVEGQMYFDTTAGDKTMYFYNGTAWIEMDGTGSGVTTVKTTNGSFIDLTPTAATTGAVTVTADLSATGTPNNTKFLRGDNVWATPSGSYTKWQYKVNGGTAIDMVDNEILNFISSTGIGLAAAAATPNTLTISNTGVTSIVAGTNVTISGATGAVTVNSTDQFQGTVKSVEVGAGLIKTGTAVDPIISVDYTSNGLIADAGTASAAAADDAVLIGVDANNNEVASVQFVDIPLSILGSPQSNVGFNSKKITSLANGTGSGDAVNLGQVQGLVAGVGLFKGGYNATSGLTTDLGAGNGSLDGASNIALDLGDFFVVTTGGTAFYGVTLEIGDTIYANQNITVNSNPAQSVYTVVIQDQNVAGEGASDGATQKGVAGFDSATFSVTSNGFVTSDIYGGGSALGVVPSGGASTTFLKGNGTWAVPANDNTQRAAGIGLSLSGNTLNVNVDGTNSVAANASSTTASRTYKVQVDSSDKLVVNVPWVDTNTQTVTSVSSSSVAGLEGISVTPTTGAVKVGLDINGLATKTEAQITFDESYVVINDDSADLNVKMALEDFTQLNTFVSGTITSYGAITHGLGSYDVMVQIYDETTKDTIQMAVERNSTNQITLSGTGTFPTGGVIVLVNRMR